MNEFEKIIVGSVVTILTGAIARLFMQVKKSNDDIIRLEMDMNQVKEKHNDGYVQLEKLIEEKFKRFEDRFIHMDNTIKANSQYFKILVEELKKK